jgi:leader peptidase (prepilin peptidase)/N-methyltransferase
VADVTCVTCFVIVTCAVLGLCVGSFLNVVVWRVPRHASVVQPPSACPTCETRLLPLELVPVLSWAFLRGRCRTCSTTISARYAVVEATTGVLFGLMGARFAGSWALPAYLVFTSVLIVLAGIDLDTLTLPRRVVYAGLVAGAGLLTLASLALGQPHRLQDAALGALGAFAFLFLLHVAAPRSMGFGDVRLAALIGLYLGWLGLLQVPIGLFLGFLLGAVVGSVALVASRSGLRTKIPFGPFLAAGAILAVLVGQPLGHVWLHA